MIGFGLGVAVFVQVNDHYFSRFYVPNIFSINNIKSTGFAGHAVTAVYFTQSQGTKSIRIAHRNKLIIGKHNQTVGTLDLLQGIQNLLNLCFFPALRNQMKNELGIRSTLKQHALLSKTIAQLFSIRQISVMPNRNITLPILYSER